MVILRKIAFTLEYDGTRYNGFQSQPDHLTIQDVVEEAIGRLVQKESRLHAASRTDAGVHAQGQVASIWVNPSFSPERIVPGLNHFLPNDIGIQRAWDICADFDVRRQAVWREYRYQILMQATPSPLFERHAFRLKHSLDIERMQKAAQSVSGLRDWAPFGPPQPPGVNTVRWMDRVEITEKSNTIVLKVVGNSFLRQQVRRMAGALVEVGLGKRTTEGFNHLIEHGSPGEAGWTLPARGLCLQKVYYRNGW